MRDVKALFAASRAASSPMLMGVEVASPTHARRPEGAGLNVTSSLHCLQRQQQGGLRVPVKAISGLSPPPRFQHVSSHVLCVQHVLCAHSPRAAAPMASSLASRAALALLLALVLCAQNVQASAPDVRAARNSHCHTALVLQRWGLRSCITPPPPLRAVLQPRGELGSRERALVRAPG